MDDRPFVDQRRVFKDQRERIQELMGALYWFRQKYRHYREEDRAEVLKLIDEVLDHEPRVIAADVRMFEQRYIGPRSMRAALDQGQVGTAQRLSARNRRLLR